MKQKNIALVLSSGGARGLAQIGCIQELESQGFNITSVAGTSIGALVGGLYAAGHLDEYTKWMESLDRFDVFSLMDFGWSFSGLLKGERVFRKMSEWLDIPIESLPIPYAAVAGEIATRKEVVFTEGNLSKAIRASVTIPNIVKPITINGRVLHDGGLITPIPLHRVKRNQGDLLVAVDLNAYKPDFSPEKYWGKKMEKENEGFFKSILPKWIGPFNSKSTKESKKKDETHLHFLEISSGVIDLMQETLSSYIIDANPPDILVKIPRNLCSTFEFYKSKELIKYGRQMMREQLLARHLVA